jgi:hypothetical protein
MTIGKRRFRCLSPTPVRVEFEPDGVSMVVYAPSESFVGFD